MHSGMTLAGSVSITISSIDLVEAVHDTHAMSCPVCLETFASSDRAGMRQAFACEHSICAQCDAQMLRRNDMRCPVCRAPRHGLTAEEAEPPPDRNAPDIHQVLGPFFAEHVAASMPPMDGFGAGVRAHVSEFMRERSRRSASTQTIFFRSQPPIAIPPRRLQFADGSDVLDAFDALDSLDNLDNTDEAETAEAAETLAARIPSTLVDALLDIPSSTASEWRSMRAREREAVAAMHTMSPPLPPPYLPRPPVPIARGRAGPRIIGQRTSLAPFAQSRVQVRARPRAPRGNNQ